jgi:nucleoside-diphosphate-sugar epimerase
MKVSENSHKRPSTLYGKTKLDAEKKIIKFRKQINICIGRIFSFTDKKQKKSFIIPIIKSKFSSKNQTIKMNNLNHYRDFISVDDIINSIYQLYKKNKNGVYNIGSGNPLNLLKLAKYLSIKNNKVFNFQNNKPTYLISNNNKLKKIGINIKPLSYQKIINA